jgi:hypothetical protein
MNTSKLMLTVASSLAILSTTVMAVLRAVSPQLVSQ